jgi:hypothetical protein
MTTEKYAKAGYPIAGAGHAPHRATTDPLPVTFVNNRVRIGLHGRNDIDFADLDYRLVRDAKIETVKMMSQTQVAVYKRLRQENPSLEFIVRLYDDRIGTNHRRPTPAEFATRFIPVINSLRLYAVKFEVHNEPNHQDLYEGWGPTLTDAKEFKTWFLDVYQRIKTAVPWAQLGFPGLALHHGGWRGDLPWVQACADAVRKADWLGCHCYWQFGNHLNFDWGLYFTEYHKLFPDKKIEITEFGDSSPNLDRALMAKQYAEYYQALQPFGLYVRSASAFIATSPDPMWRQFAWADLDTKQPHPVVGSVAAINRTQIVDEAFVDKLAGVKDWRGQLPTRDRALPYDKRDVKGITYVVIHHTAGPSSWSANAGGAGNGLAGWDVTQTDRDPYPEITYHFVVNADGTIERCHSLDVLAWHAGAKGLPSPGSVGINNWKGVAVCLPGSFMAAAVPTDLQLEATAKLCQALLKQCPGATVAGHRDIVPAGSTQCPGDTWAPAAVSGWRDKLLALIGEIRVEPPAFAYTLTVQTPGQIQQGAMIAVPVTLKNTSNRTWTAAGPNPIRFSYHWADDAGNVLVLDGERTSLPADLVAGQEVTLQAALKAPATAGSVELQWDVVEEGIAWFSQKGVPMTKAPVDVTAIPAPPPQPAAWKAIASHASADAVKAVDGDPLSAWSTGVAQAQGAWFMLDMGAPYVISGFKASSPKGAFPRGYALYVSMDSKNWTKVAESIENSGDLSAVFTETRARYLRLDLILPPWAISDISVDIASSRAWTATASHNGADAAKAVDGKPATRWSTTVPQQPGMWFQVDMGSPQRVKRLFLDSSKDEAPRGYKISISMDNQTWREVASRPLNYSPVDVTLGLPMARYIRIENTAADKFNYPWTINECTIETAAVWIATASHNNDQAGNAVDGLDDSFWTSATPQTNAMWYELDLGETQTIGKVVLENPAKDFPRGLAVKVSADDKTWTEVGRIARFYAGPAALSFTPVQARYIRFEQTSDVVQVNRWAINWSISEVNLFPAG